jgi:hypothetical protein
MFAVRPVFLLAPTLRNAPRSIACGSISEFRPGRVGDKYQIDFLLET